MSSRQKESPSTVLICHLHCSQSRLFRIILWHFCSSFFLKDLFQELKKKKREERKESQKERKIPKLQAMWVSAICRKYFQNVVAKTGHVLNLRYLSKFLNYACKPHEVPLLSNTLLVGDNSERRFQGLPLALPVQHPPPLPPCPHCLASESGQFSGAMLLPLDPCGSSGPAHIQVLKIGVTQT